MKGYRVGLGIVLGALAMASLETGAPAIAQTLDTDQSKLQRQRELLIQKRQQQQKTRTLLEINPSTGKTETPVEAAASSSGSTVVTTTPSKPKPAVAASKAEPVVTTVAAAAEIAPAPAVLSEEDQLFRPIKFAYDSAFLSPDARTILNGLCNTLKADLSLNPESGYFVLGHTDASGSDDYNRRLSQRRAEAAKQYLVSDCGIASARLEAIGMGEERLLANFSPRAANQRRVEIQVNIGSDG